MQETNKEHKKQQERKEMNSEVSTIVQIEHAWKYIMNSGQRARNPKRSSSSIKLWEMNVGLKEINEAPEDISMGLMDINQKLRKQKDVQGQELWEIKR